MASTSYSTTSRPALRRRAALRTRSATAELGFFDEHDIDGLGNDDVWSSYWYDGLIYSNGGLDRSAYPTNRGLDIYSLDDPAAARAAKLGHMNPQTQENLLGSP